MTVQDHVPLGMPQHDPSGAPTLHYDQAPRIRRGFSYQDYAAFSLALRSLKDEGYTELWQEHHEDVLAVRRDGLYDLYQVKTRDQADSPWRLSDEELRKCLRRFCALEAQDGAKINRYVVYSNVKSYLPAPSAGAVARSQSPAVIKHELVNAASAALPVESRSIIDDLAGRFAVPVTVLETVLQKLDFVVGPGIDAFMEIAPFSLCDADPRLRNWPLNAVRRLQEDLVLRINKAGSLGAVTPLDLHTSLSGPTGVADAEVWSRRLSVPDIQDQVDRWIRRRRRGKFAVVGGFGALAIIVGALLLRPVFQETPAQHALNVVQGSAGLVQPAEFRESIAIIRAAKLRLDGVSWNHADLVCQDMSGLSMARATGEGVKGTGANFDRAFLPSSWFKRGELNGSRFQFARMDEVTLEEANMVAANLYGAEARNAKMAGVTLNAANVSHGDFTGTDLSGANLSLADLRETDFQRADFTNAIFEDADISGANFKGAKHLTQEMLDSACQSSSRNAIVDSPLKPPSRMCFGNAKEKEERMVKRLLILFTAQAAVIQGVCKDGTRWFRQADSKLHPEDNTKVLLDPAMLQGPLKARESYE